MKGICLLLCGLLLLGSSGCTKRSVATSAVLSEELPAPSKEQVTASVDLHPLTRITVGQALLSHVKEVSSVTITEQESGEVVYESTDELLSQSFFDALQIRREQLELPEESADYVVHFTSPLGVEQSCGLYLNLKKQEPVIVQWEDECWDLPEDESNWLRSRLNGLI